MAGNIFSEWKQAWYNNAHRLIEWNTISVNTQLGAVGQETGFIDIPNFGNPIFGITLRLNGNFTTNANNVALATNVPGRAFDVRIYKPDGKPLVYLTANGGVRVHTIAPAGNDTISPGDPVMYSELFCGHDMAKVDRVSGRLGPQNANGSVYCNIFIPVYIPADAGTHKLQLRNSQFTWAAGTGTIYAANPANVPAVSTWTLEMIEHCLPVGTTMSYFGVTNPQTIGLVVGDNYMGQFLNRGQLVKALLIQSALPANLDDIRMTQDAIQIVDTEFEDLEALTEAMFDTDFATDRAQAYGIEEFAAGAAIVHSPHRNVGVVLPGDLMITDNTQLHITCNTAAQNIRLMQFMLIDLPRTASRPEVVSTQPAPSSPVVAVGSKPIGPGATSRVGGGGVLGGFVQSMKRGRS